MILAVGSRLKNKNVKHIHKFEFLSIYPTFGYQPDNESHGRSDAILEMNQTRTYECSFIAHALKFQGNWATSAKHGAK